jgi:hypothetical protein
MLTSAAIQSKGGSLVAAAIGRARSNDAESDAKAESTQIKAATALAAGQPGCTEREVIFCEPEVPRSATLCGQGMHVGPAGPEQEFLTVCFATNEQLKLRGQKELGRKEMRALFATVCRGWVVDTRHHCPIVDTRHAKPRTKIVQGWPKLQDLAQQFD